MGYYKNLLIEMQESKLTELYEDYHIEHIIINADKQQTTNKLMYEELLLSEQIKKDKEENK